MSEVIPYQSPCPRPSECGSCSWSSIPYAQQLLKKQSEISAALTNSGVQLESPIEIIASPRTEHYRNRMDFVIGFKGQVGLREKGKWWKILDNHHCMVSDNPIEEAFSIIRTWVTTSGLTFFDRKKHTGLLRYAVVRATRLGERMVTIVTSVPLSQEEDDVAREKLTSLACQLSSSTVIWSINTTTGDVSFGQEDRVLSGAGVIHEEIGGKRYVISPHAFFQTNSYASPLLLETVKEFCGDCSGRTLLDLYCGTGFFSIALASTTQKTVGVELSPSAIADAKVNARNNNLEIEYIDAKTEQFSWREIAPDIVLIDPPRSGLHPQVITDLLTTDIPKMVYISCNYEKFCEEYKILSAKYRIDRIRAIDLFPHTPHVEVVFALSKRTNQGA